MFTTVIFSVDVSQCQGGPASQIFTLQILSRLSSGPELVVRKPTTLSDYLVMLIKREKVTIFGI